jgi:hypothetical protein
MSIKHENYALLLEVIFPLASAWMKGERRDEA